MQRKTTPTFLISLIFIFPLFSQPNLIWETTYGGSQSDNIKYVMPTDDDNFLVIGTTYSNNGDMANSQGSSFSDRDVFAAKVSSSTGNILWKRSFDVGLDYDDDDASLSVIAYEANDGYVIVGDTENGTSQNFILKTIKNTGIPLGGNAYLSTGAGYTCIAPTSSQDIYILGSRTTSLPTNARVHLFNYNTTSTIGVIENPTGATYWGHIIKKIIPTPDGGYLLFGEDTFSPCGEIGNSIWVCKLTSNFGVAWTRVYGGNANDVFLDAEVKPDNGFYLLGRTNQFCNFGTTGPSNVGQGDWILELNSFGNEVQNPVIVSFNAIDALKTVDAFDLATDGSLLFTGHSSGMLGGDAYVENRTYQGNQTSINWNYFFDFTAVPYGYPNGITELSNGNLLCYGDAIDGDTDFWVAHLGNPITPNCNEATPIFCGQTISNQTTGAVNNFTASNYNNCYSGTDNYNGEDAIYRLNVNETQQYKIVLDVQTNQDLDLFLLDNCGNTISCSAATTVNNNDSQTFKEIIDEVLSPDVYYIIVDGKNENITGNFSLSIACDCKCSEPETDQPDGTKYLCEDFEAFDPAPIPFQSTRWRLWDMGTSPSPAASVVSSNDNYLHVEQQGSTSPNVIYELDNLTSGRHRLSWNMLVNEGFEGYFNVLHELPDNNGNNPNRAYEVYFRENGVGEIGINNQTLGTFNFSHDVWFRVMQIIDIDNNQMEFWIDDQLIAFFPFSSNDGGFSMALTGINFYAIDAASYFIDNICLWTKENTCASGTFGEPVCIPSGGNYNTPQDARCDLYISSEWQNCFSICDQGGPFIYRGETFEGTLTDDDLLPVLSLVDPCVFDAYDGEFPTETMVADVYSFFNDELNQNILVELTTSDPFTRAFIFRCVCEDDGTGEIVCEQECLGESNSYVGDNEPIGFYYVMVLGPTNVEPYTIKITPSGVCDNNVTIVKCDTIISGNTEDTGEIDFDTFNDNGNYSLCYDGDKTYEGNDVEYKFFVEQPTILDVTLTPENADMGLFLYSFLCGRNCIDYAEAVIPGDPVSLDSILLDPGVYYLIVDKDSGIGDEFELTVNCPVDNNFIIQLFDFETDSCSTVNGGGYEIQINENADKSANFLNANTAIVYMLDLPSGEQSPVYSEYWNNPNDFMPFLLEQDDLTNASRCAYIDGDSIRVRVLSSQNAGLCDITFDSNSTNPNMGTFQEGRLDVITELSIQDLSYFQVSPSYINVPAVGPDAGNAARRLLVGSSGIPWKMTEEPEVDWLEVNPDTNITEGPAVVFIEENTSQFPRETILRTQFYEEDIDYFRYTFVRQEGRCLLADVNIVADPPFNEICENDTLRLTAVPVTPRVSEAYNYLWSNGETTPTIALTNYQDGEIISVRITDKFCGKTDEQAITITVEGAPTSPISQGDKTICFGEALPVLSVDTGNGIVAEWYDEPEGGTLLYSGDNFPVPSNLILMPDTYHFYVQAKNNSNDCRSPLPRTMVSLIVDERPTVDAGLDVVACPEVMVTLQAVGNNGTAPYNFAWNNNLGTEESVLVPAINETYEVTITDINGCTNEASVAVIVADAPTAMLSPQDPTCGEANGSIIASISGGMVPYSYAWSNGQIQATIDNLSPDNYILTVTDANNCKDEVEIILQDQPGPNLTVSPDLVVCEGDEIQMTAVGVGGTGSLSYQWSNNLGLTPTVMTTPAQDESYTVIVTDENNCTKTESINVTVHPRPQISFSGNTIICPGETAIVSAEANGMTDIICFWDNANSPSACQQTFTPSTDESHTVLVRNTNTGCESEASIDIMVNIPPSANASSTSADCNQATGSATVLPSGGAGGYTFLWSNNQTSQTIDNLAADTYFVTVTDLAGCTVEAFVDVENESGPDLLFPVQQPGCAGSIYFLNLEVLNGVGGYTFEWNDALDDIQNPPIQLTDDTVYSVTVTDANGCSSVASTNVSVNQPISIDFSNIPNQLCIGDTITLNPLITGNFSSVTWSATPIGDFSNPFSPITGFTTNNSSASTIELTLTGFGLIPCPAQVPETISISLNIPPTIENVMTECAPDLLSYILTFESAADQVLTNFGNVTSENNVWTVSGIPEGQMVHLDLSNTLTECASIEMIAPPSCECNVTAPQFLGNAVICEGDDIPILEVQTDNDLLVNWYDAAGNLLAQNTDSVFEPDEAGSYFAEAVDPVSSCTSDALTEVTLTISPAPSIMIEGVAETCPGDTIILTAEVMGDFDEVIWNTGETGLEAMFTPNQNISNYTATASLGNCEDVANIEVMLFETESWDIIIGDFIECFGDEDGFISIESASGAIPSSTVWNTTSQTTPFLVNIGAGNYQATIQDQNGCEFILQESLNQPSQIVVDSIDMMPEANELMNGSLTLNVTGGTPDYTINLRIGTPNGPIDANGILDNVMPGMVEFTNLNSNLYFIEVIDANDCVVSETSITVDLINDLQEQYQNLGWQLYPNPSNGQVYIELNSPITNQFEILVMNVFGQEVYKQTDIPRNQTHFEMDLGELSKGVYMVYLNIEGFLLAKKLVIQ